MFFAAIQPSLNRGSIREDFAACGLSHLIAVSGSHLAIVARLVQNVLWRCGLDSRKSRVLMLGACCFYTLLTGAAPSTIRSVCMVGCTNVSMGSGRRSHALSSLSLTLIVMLVIWPNLVFDLGFQLSALSVASILIFGRYVSYALHVLRLPSFIAEGMGITLTAQIATLPLTTLVFGQISLSSPGGECDYRASYFTSFGFRGRCGNGPLDSWHIGFSGIASSFVFTGHSLFC